MQLVAIMNLIVDLMLVPICVWARRLVVVLLIHDSLVVVVRQLVLLRESGAGVGVSCGSAATSRTCCRNGGC